MKVTALYDGSDGTARSLVEALGKAAAADGHGFEGLDASTLALAPCVGCFGCWIKTPGVCCLPEDSGPALLRAILASDAFVYVSKITWGGYSAVIKNCADRTLPLLHPFFRTLKGETHHVQRYARRPRFLVVGFGARDEGSRADFIEYAQAHRDNAGSPDARGVMTLTDGEDAVSALGAWLGDALRGAKRRKAEAKEAI
jgi:multimeric flavodoxin WrbA